ncbi:hypothetical protein JCM10212_003241 [Sporobolomyces blumeae]
MPLNENPPCQAEACAIQTCLASSNFQQPRCTPQIMALYACCEKMYSLGSKTSTACPNPDKLRTQLEDLRNVKS